MCLGSSNSSLGSVGGLGGTLPASERANSGTRSSEQRGGMDETTDGPSQPPDTVEPFFLWLQWSHGIIREAETRQYTEGVDLLGGSLDVPGGCIQLCGTRMPAFLH